MEESCAAERSLHASLLEAPGRPIEKGEIEALADEDARHNYRMILKFRDGLREAGTLESWYWSRLGSSTPIDIPPLFVDHVVHAIVRNILDGETDPFLLRAGECLFREQVVTVHEGAILLVDSEIVELRKSRQEGGLISLLDLASSPELANDTIEVDVLSDANTGAYWARCDNFDMALDVTFPREGLTALCRVLERWIRHFLAVDVEIQPTGQITDERWVWHLGLDAHSTALLNDLYEGRTVEDDRYERLLSLFRLTFRIPAQMRADIAGRPVYMGLSRSPAGRLRLKPQNLLAGLPLASRS